MPEKENEKTGYVPTAEDVTNFHLYRQEDKPNDMLDPSTWGSYGSGEKPMNMLKQ